MILQSSSPVFCIVVKMKKRDVFTVRRIGGIGEVFDTNIEAADRFTERPPYNNLLNKKLYPNRVEHRGFLLPPEIAEKLNEEE